MIRFSSGVDPIYLFGCFFIHRILLSRHCFRGNYGNSHTIRTHFLNDFLLSMCMQAFHRSLPFVLCMLNLNTLI